MARADRRRSTRSRPVAATTRAQSAYVGTDQLFFQRLRRQAKWMFVFLALVFAVGFVAFGVGGEVQGGIADAIRFGGEAGTSVEDAQEKVRENPKNPALKLELANALLADRRTNQAIVVLESYTEARPKDTDALRTLAGVYLTQASRSERRVRAAQSDLARYSVVQTVLPQLGTGAAATYFGDTAVNQALAAEANERYRRAASATQLAFDNAKQTYERLVAAEPNDPDLQLELATAAQQAGDTETTIRAYKAFIRLAPEDDATVAEVRRQVRLLERAAAQQPAPVGG